ncbi:hypothetical protein [Halorientalis sp.]|uniref:hypothetical protein n=1 Tax=Halorientalis sp. TaxID=1931229 RepID=UPI002622FD1D|nr:hypothetical protein [Halorientalis sp.]
MAETTTDDDRRPTDRRQAASKVRVVADGRISAVELTVVPALGAGPVGLDVLIVQRVGANGTDDVATTSGGATVDGGFRLAPVTDSDDSASVVDVVDDRMRLSMALWTTDGVSRVEEFGESLRPGVAAAVRVATGSSATATVRLRVSQTLAGEQAVTL